MGDWVLRFDGLYEPRYRTNGVATYGFVVEHDGKVVHEAKGVLARPGEPATANVAEFGALIAGLTWLRHRGLGGCALRVYGDSRLVCETVAGRWRLRSERLAPWYAAARELVEELAPVEVRKVPRDENAAADRLTREAYHEALAEHPEWRARWRAEG